MEIKIKIGNVTSQGAQITPGLREGDGLSPLLFNIALEKVNGESNTEEYGIRFDNRRFGTLAYADDIEEDEKSFIELIERIFIKLYDKSHQIQSIYKDNYYSMKNLH